MSGKRWALLGGLFALLVGGVALLMVSTGRGPDGGAEEPGSAALVPGAGPDTAAALAEGAAPEAPAGTQAGAAGRAQVAPTGGEIDLDRAVWIAGRVLIPAGAPLDESLEVVAVPLDAAEAAEAPDEDGPPADWRGELDEPTGWSRRQVEGDGSFRVPLAEGTQGARLHLDGRYLFLERPLRLSAQDLELPALLEPELGAALVTRFRPPAGVEPAELAGKEVELQGLRGGMMMGFGSPGAERKLPLGADGSVEFRGLPAEGTYMFALDPEFLVGHRELDVRLSAGELVQREVALKRGATLRGVVVDEGGQALAGANVRVSLRGQFAGFAPGADRSAETDAEGRFELLGVRPRRLVVRASMEDRLRAETEELRPRDGEELGGLTLSLAAGASIAGVVRFPDGAPAAGAEVELRQNGSGDEPGRWRPSRTVECDAEGTFAAGGLEPDGEYGVRASLRVEGEGDDVRWRAPRADVPAGAREVELTLVEPGVLGGRVVDAAGTPLERFTIRATARDGELGGGARVARPVEATDGRFELGGVFPGEWAVAAEAEGYLMTEPGLRVELPQAAELTIVMERGAAVAGLVLDPTGAPVSGARVVLDDGGRRMGPRGPGFMGMGQRGEETDAEGRFAIEGVAPGAHGLRATSEGWAPSARLELELGPDQRAEELVLTLTLGGSLTGEVYDKEGAPDPGRNINLFTMDGGQQGRTGVSDDVGRFAIEHLAPGQYTVMAQPDFSRFAEMEERDEELSPVDFMSEMKMTSVEIVEGETAHVVIGAPPVAPVRLFGRVTEAGAGADGGALMVIGEDRSLLEAWKPAKVGADGSYEIVLDEPGNYLVTYQDSGFGPGGVEFHLQVPEVEELQFDVELPTGRIEGVVLDPAGAPLAGARVNLSRESGLAGLTFFGGGNGETTGEDGTFTIERLRAATYTLRASGRGGSEVAYATAILGDLAVGEGQAVSGVKLQLRRPGTLAGTVLAEDGGPIAGATVFVRDAAGRPVDAMSATVTDGDGRFEHRRIAPGEYSVLARTGEAASAERKGVRVSEDAETDVELRLGAATILRVVVEEAGGTKVRASLSVVDEEGREHARLRSFAGMEAAFSEGFSTTEQRVGPLPPGKYRVTVTTEDGRSEKRSVKLTGKPERKLRLRLD